MKKKGKINKLNKKNERTKNKNNNKKKKIKNGAVVCLLFRSPDLST